MTSIPRRVWLDTETTKLAPSRRAWDVALIVRDRELEDDLEYQWFVHPIDLDLEYADAKALEIGGFWERHPHAPTLLQWGLREMIEAEATQLAGQLDMRRLGAADNVRRARYVAQDVHALTRDRSQIYGSNPSFDMQTLEMMLFEEGLVPQWHYHPNDVPNLIEGWLIGRISASSRSTDFPTGRKSEDWCRAVGVEPNDYPRHTALGDCQLFRDAFDAMFGGIRS